MPYLSEAVETLSRKQLEALQLRKLRSFLAATYRKNGFYRDRFDSRGLKPDDIRTLADFRRLVPLCDKNDLLDDQNRHPVYGTRMGVPLSEVVEFHLSGGTSGRGQEIYAFTAADMECAGTSFCYHFVWSGIEYGDALAMTLPVSTGGASLSFMAGVRKMGCKPLMLGTLEARKRLELMHHLGAHYLFITPVYLARLSATLEEMKLDPKQYLPLLKTINLSAGSYPVEWAQQMEDYWGAKVHETYACASASQIVAATCENGVFDAGRGRGCQHLLEAHLLVEVLDPETGQPVASGGEGELVVTTIDKVASPVIRFRTGDKVRFLSHERCSCGRPFDSIECGTIARLDDMVKVKGMNLWPQALDEVVFAHAEIEEYNARVSVDPNGREIVEVLVDFRAQVGEEAKARVLALLPSQLHQKTGISMSARQGAAGEVERFVEKTRRLKDARQQSLAKQVASKG
jgi:phenylacetate-CoA ligase